MKGLRRLQRRMYEEISIREIADKATENSTRQTVAFFCYIMMPVSIVMMPVVPPVVPPALAPQQAPQPGFVPLQ